MVNTRADSRNSVSGCRRKDVSKLWRCDGGGLMFQKYHMTAMKYGDHNTYLAHFSDFRYLSAEAEIKKE
jgi:hypothetical protein